MVHDIGKATPVFQTMKGYLNSSELDILLLEKLERAGYKDITNLVLASPKSSRHEITGEYILSLYGVKNDIGSAIMGKRLIMSWITKGKIRMKLIYISMRIRKVRLEICGCIVHMRG